MIQRNDGQPREEQGNNPWEGAPVIFSYSRADAIRDGVLVDLSQKPHLAKLCQQAAFRLPIAMTAGAWRAVIECDHIPPGQGQSVLGRLWDVLVMLHLAIRANRHTDRVDFKVRVWDGKRFTVVDLWCHCGPGDTPEPVLTIMLQGED